MLATSFTRPPSCLMRNLPLPAGSLPAKKSLTDRIISLENDRCVSRDMGRAFDLGDDRVEAIDARFACDTCEKLHAQNILRPIDATDREAAQVLELCQPRRGAGAAGRAVEFVDVEHQEMRALIGAVIGIEEDAGRRVIANQGIA